MVSGKKVLSASLFALLFALSHNAAAQDEFSENSFIRALAGDVTVQKPGTVWGQAQMGLELAIGDSVRTGADGRAEIFLAGTAIIKINQNTEFQIPQDNYNSQKRVSLI
ncbi:MAG: hypothetical protein PHQ23_00305 [Candidatus Wallbacteria bacterium]|nr:hypothetical protein [Candidatus Wallbacteria bacterium]